jgi:periplasmic binding family protein
VVNAVSQDRNGIGYGGISFVKGVKALPIRKDEASAAVFPDFANVADGSYPISRFLYWYLPNAPEGEVKRLVDWVTSAQGQALVKEVGYFPISARAPLAEHITSLQRVQPQRAQRFAENDQDRSSSARLCGLCGLCGWMSRFICPDQ